MRIVVLHQHYWPEVAATAQILSDLCEDLSARGHEVIAVCGQPSYRRVEGLGTRLPSRESHEGVQIERVWSYTAPKRTIARRIVHYGTFFTTSLGRVLTDRRPDLALVLSTPPLLLGVSGVILRALRGVPFLYSVQDLYPDVALHLGVLKPGPLANVIDRTANAIYARAARVVTLSERMAERLTEKGVRRERVSVIPNWADTDRIKPAPRDNAFAHAHGLDDKFVVQYSGNVGMSQGLEHLPDAAERVRDIPVKFAVVGDGSARRALEEKTRARGLTNLVFLPPQPREHLQDLLAASDVGFVPMVRSVTSDLVPSKLYGILAAGRPVLASVGRDTEVAEVVMKYDCGHVVTPEDPVALADGVRMLYERRERLEAMGARGREVCERLFSRRSCTARYADAIRETVGREAHA